MPQAGAQPAPEAAAPSETEEFDSMARRETLELVRAYYRIGDPSVRKRTFDLVKALGGDRDAASDSAAA